MEGFATVEEALEELRNGKLILVTAKRKNRISMRWI